MKVNSSEQGGQIESVSFERDEIKLYLELIEGTVTSA